MAAAPIQLSNGGIGVAVAGGLKYSDGNLPIVGQELTDLVEIYDIAEDEWSTSAGINIPVGPR